MSSNTKLHSAPKVAFILSIILLIAVAGVIFWQRNGLDSVIAQNEQEEGQGVNNDPEETPSPKPARVELTWQLATSSAAWTARDSQTTFKFKDKLWLLGGINAEDQVLGSGKTAYWEAEHFNDIWTSENGVDWKRVRKAAEFPPRRSMSVAHFNGALWMLGGWSPVSGYANEIWTSKDGIHWERVQTAPWPAREGQLVKIFNGKLWMLGGVNYDERTTFNDVWVTEDGVNWEKAGTAPWSPRWDHAIEVFNGELFVTGGMDLDGGVFGDVWKTEDGINWQNVTESAPWPTRQGHGLVAFDDALWLVGRLNDREAGGVNDVWYSKDGTTWNKTNKDPQWAGREDATVEVFRGAIWVFGGMDKDLEWRNDIWTSTTTSS